MLHPTPQRKPFSCRDALVGVTNDPDEVEFLLAAGRKHKAYNLWDKIHTGKGYDSLDGVTSGFNACKFDPTRPARTIRKNDGEIGMFGGMHWTERRKFTVREYCRFASFPDPFVFLGEWKDAVARIGNSVPPLFMRAIAQQIRSVVFGGELPEIDMTKKYPQILEEAWADHLKEKEANAPTVVSTFAGCGGSSLGYSMAGYRELLAVEWDDNAVATFRANFPGVDVYHGDIGRVTVDQVLKWTGLGVGELDVLDGSPPCQGFSTSGKRQLDDERNQLYKEFGRLLSGLMPKVFVMENVSGMVKGKMKLLFVEILKDLKARGYKVSARTMNAMYYNVPQSRQRLIFIGVREDLGIDPSHPKPESNPISASEGLQGCESKRHARPLGPLAMQIWNTAKPGQSGSDLDWTKGRYFNSMRLDPTRPSPTITKGFPGGGGHMHWEAPRSLSIQEVARLQSFPDPFQFFGSFDQQWARVGNSVPPLLMRAIARNAREEIIGR